MTPFERLDIMYPGRVERPTDITDIRPSAYYVYILTMDERAIVLGHGKKNRARVIFDSVHSNTPNHIKALIVRIYHLFSDDGVVFDRYLIPCTSKDEAKEIEAVLHRKLHGNTLKLPTGVQQKLFDGFDGFAANPMRMALCSSFDGISDLKRWRREGILDDTIWRQITGKLNLPYDGHESKLVQ